MTSPFKGQTGLKRIFNAAGYSLDGLRAAFKGEAGIVRLLLEKGAQVDGAGDGSRTALMVAAMFDRTEIVDLLLAHGADPSKRDASGMSAADMARQMGAQNTPAQLERAQGG